GTSWSVVPSPNTDPGQSNFFLGVACVSASDCWAAGRYNAGNFYQTLVDHWDGTSWTIVPSPSSAVQDSLFNAVGCASTSECWAVGYYNELRGGASVSQSLIEQWDGTSWTTVTAPDV